jgi:hypothetical protein
MYVVKELKANGIDATFLIGQHGKTFRSRYSADETGVIVGIFLNVLSGGIWDAVKTTFALLRLRANARKISDGSDRATFRIGMDRSPDGTESVWQEFSGPPEATLAHAEAATLAYLEKFAGPRPTD